jgi:hypothetical protein
MKISVRYAGLILLVLLSLVFISCGGGGVAQQDYDNLKAQFDQLSATSHSQLTALQSDYDEAKAQLTEAQQNYNDAKTKLDSAQSELSTTKASLSSASDELDKAQTEASQLQTRLDKVLATVLTQYYTVSYPPYHYAWSLSVKLGDYFDYKDKGRVNALGVYVTVDDPALISLAGMIRNSSQSDNLKQSDVVNLISKFVQSLPHTDTDVRTADDSYPRYPLETLVDQGGDSEDTSILAATLLSLLDYDVVLLSFESENHVAVGVNLSTSGGKYWEYQGKRYYYLGTTGDYRKLGETPTQFLYLTPTIYPVD